MVESPTLLPALAMVSAGVVGDWLFLVLRERVRGNAVHTRDLFLYLPVESLCGPRPTGGNCHQNNVRANLTDQSWGRAAGRALTT